MRAAVTGARGFVGRHLTTYLTAHGTDVVELDRDGAWPVDITDHDAVARRFAEARPRVVYHLAAQPRRRVVDRRRSPDARVNVDGTRAVLDACVETGVERIIVVGSAEQYGAVRPDELPVVEATPLRPITPYGESKVAAERLALEIGRSSGLAVICTRAFNHTGPGQSPAFLVPGLAARIAAAERDAIDEIVLGNGDPVRDFSDVRDVVRAYVLLAEHGVAGEAYNVCSGRPARVGDVAAALVSRSTRALDVTTAAELVRPVDIPVLVGDPAKLVAATGWEPRFDLDRTLDDVLAAARVN